MFAECIMCHLAHSVVAVSEHGKENLKKYVKVPERELLTMPSRVEATSPDENESPAEFRTRFDIPPDAPLVGLGARFDEQKGIKYLIRPRPEVLDRHPGVDMVLAGYGPQDPRWRADSYADLYDGALGSLWAGTSARSITLKGGVHPVTTDRDVLDVERPDSPSSSR